jgi:hypothetical protein
LSIPGVTSTGGAGYDFFEAINREVVLWRNVNNQLNGFGPRSSPTMRRKGQDDRRAEKHDERGPLSFDHLAARATAYLRYRSLPDTL